VVEDLGVDQTTIRHAIRPDDVVALRFEDRLNEVIQDLISALARLRCFATDG